MPKISDLSSYGQDASITGDEYLIGTDVGGATKTFTLTSIADYVETALTIPIGGLGEINQSIPAGATRTVNIGLSGSLIFQYNSSTRITLNSASTTFASGASVIWSDAPTNSFDLTNKDYVDTFVGTQVALKQDTLVSGTNIKTVNGTTLLGSGNLVIADDGLAAQNQVLTVDRDIDLDTNDLNFRIGTGGRFFVIPDSLGASSMSIDDDGEVFFSNTGSTMAKVAGTATSGFDIVNYQTMESFGNIAVKNLTIVSAERNLTLGSSFFAIRDNTNTFDVISFRNNQVVIDGAIPIRCGYDAVDPTDLTHKSYVDTQVSTKQDILVSGTNIKTINGSSILGSGDLTVSGSGGDLWSDPVDSDILPATTNTYDLGATGNIFAEGHFNQVNSNFALLGEFQITPKATPGLVATGSVYFDNSSLTLELHDGTSFNSILTDKVLIDDDTFATASSTTVASSESIKAYVDSNLSGLENAVISDTSGLTNAIQITSIVAGTQSDIESWPDDAGRLSIPTDATPATINTGTVLFMNGFNQLDNTSVDTTTFTLDEIEPGGYYEVLVNQPTEPSITGATKIPNTADFIADTDMLMCVKVFNSTVKYFFMEW